MTGAPAFPHKLEQSEKQFQMAVVEYAHHRGWKVAHFHDSRREVVRKSGHRLIIGDKDSAGFPDLTMARGDRLIFAELKTGRRKLTEAQQAWQEALLRVALGNEHVEVFVWRPSDWSSVEATLR